MRRFVSTLSLLMFVALIINAQLKLDDVIPGGKSFAKYYLWPYNVEFRGEANQLVFQRQDSVIVQTIGSEKQELLFDLAWLNKLMKENGQDELKRMPRLKWQSENNVVINARKNIFLIDIKLSSLKVIETPVGAANSDWLNDYSMLAYTKENDLYIQNEKGEELEVASSEDSNIVFGTTVHRNEFGIHKGTFWSPNEDQLAFYRKDESMVSDYPLVNVDERVAKLENIKYPMAGMASHHVTVGVYNVASKQTVYLKTGEPKDRFFTNVTWTPDGKYLLIAELNREQNHMHLNKYDAQTGELVKTLFEEKDEKWVEPQHAALFIPGSTNLFIWQSVKSGYNHLYLYDLEGKLKKQLTSGDWEVINVDGFDKKGKNLFVQTTKDGVLESHAYKVSVSSGKLTKITQEAGVHRVKISADGKYALTRFSSLKVPSKTNLLSTTGKLIETLNVSENPYKDIEVGEVKLIDLKTKDGTTDLHGRIVLPPNFDAGKKYPVIVYVYGGPHSQMVQNRWMGGARGWQLYMAQKGYIAFTLDNRGTQHRGKDFEQAIHRQLGVLEVEDQMQGIEYLKSLPYVDADKIGVHGWSYGGFMTISMMTKHADVFKVGVAGGPVIDWSYYEIMYGERYMDTPEENPEGYANANLKETVENLEGRLMLIHGAIDPVVVWQHSLSYVRECVKKGVQLDYFMYPRHEHNVRGRDRVHLMEKVTRYFDDFLK
ncbi:S9 family peptidase [Carboxylicivirga sp. N1Y90]|uniref:S9 family peptidase n=1 Tax=Carboxylicivirga fragile TaxID=3417571 RepID=UPI003D352EC3|nr:S9 family peptidase [Marinilabiliaceae bacterium N1Y90]